MDKKNMKKTSKEKIKKIQKIIIAIKEDPEAIRQAKRLIIAC